MTTLLSPQERDALERWLTHLRALDGAAANTITAYARDVTRFLAFLATHRGGTAGTAALASLPQQDIRAWMAHERARGLQARSLARALSAVKGFTAWAADRDGVDATAILSTRGPKHRRKLPRPLSEEGARAMLETVGDQAREDWIAARDTAVVTLLYGCGLRISEALGLTGADHPLPDTLRITGKGGKTRLVPVLPAARDAVARYVRLCPHHLSRHETLFRGAARARSTPPIALVSKRRDAARPAQPPPPPMRSATASPPTSCRPAATCAPFRNCSATPPCPQRRHIPPSTPPD